VYTTDPSVRHVSTPYLDVLLQPQPAAGHAHFNAFRFVITNKTERPLLIDWDDTYYLLNGRRQGQFGWEGMRPSDLSRLQENPVAIVAPGTTRTVVVFPVTLLAAAARNDQTRLGGPGTEGQAVLGVLPEGLNGMELTVQQDGGQLRETLILRIKSGRR
jgi:hypothetical protein